MYGDLNDIKLIEYEMGNMLQKELAAATLKIVKANECYKKQKQVDSLAVTFEVCSSIEIGSKFTMFYDDTGPHETESGKTSPGGRLFLRQLVIACGITDQSEDGNKRVRADFEPQMLVNKRFNADVRLTKSNSGGFFYRLYDIRPYTDEFKSDTHILEVKEPPKESGVPF